jgi:hypothetical protein
MICTNHQPFLTTNILTKVTLVCFLGLWVSFCYCAWPANTNKLTRFVRSCVPPAILWFFGFRKIFKFLLIETLLMRSNALDMLICMNFLCWCRIRISDEQVSSYISFPQTVARRSVLFGRKEHRLFLTRLHVLGSSFNLQAVYFKKGLYHAHTKQPNSPLLVS